MPRTFFKLLPGYRDGKSSYSAKEINDHEDWLKSEFPIRHAINEWLYDNIYMNVYWMRRRLKDLVNWFRYRLIPSRQYHKIIVGPPGYYEPYELILQAPFIIFVRFMDNIYAGDSYVIWDYSNVTADQNMTSEYIEQNQKRWVEMEALYRWWTVERPGREAELDKLDPPPLPAEWGMLSMFNDDYADTPEVINVRESYRRRHEMENIHHLQDEEMLCRLAAIRRDLWD